MRSFYRFLFILGILSSILLCVTFFISTHMNTMIPNLTNEQLNSINEEILKTPMIITSFSLCFLVGILGLIDFTKKGLQFGKIAIILIFLAILLFLKYRYFLCIYAISEVLIIIEFIKENTGIPIKKTQVRK